MHIWALFLKEKRSLKDKNFPILSRLINLALIINANLRCSKISICIEQLNYMKDYIKVKITKKTGKVFVKRQRHKNFSEIIKRR